jgi:CDP-glucose 4,6-dehydratase
VEQTLNFYKNKRIFLTGHSGFKGSWLNLWLTSLGADVFGYSLEPETQPALYNVLNLKNGIFADILDSEMLERTMKAFKPDIVFHLAAQPLVRKSYREPVLTYQTNVIGTLNVLEAARKCGTVKGFVNITTDKVYENKEEDVKYKETDPLGGYDMYSSSKACSEILSASYRRSFLHESEFALATARAGNVIGGGDWAEDRLIPDCIKSINSDSLINIRSPRSVRPWQHVLEPLAGYLILGERLYNYGNRYAESFNFGPDEVVTVKDVADMVCELYGKGTVVYDESEHPHEANLLMLDPGKAKSVLGWKMRYDTKTAVQKTVEWYKEYYEGADMKVFSLKQIEDYTNEI